MAIKYMQGGGFGRFDAGNSYKVKFQVYGITTINTTVTVSPWLAGGNASIDTEEKPEL